jgi:glutaminyl-tRNA synthetase
VEYVDSIIADVKWLIDGWADHVLRFKRVGETSGRPAEPGQANVEPFYASDYFQQLHDYAVLLIKAARPTCAISTRSKPTSTADRRQKSESIRHFANGAWRRISISSRA